MPTMRGTYALADVDIVGDTPTVCQWYVRCVNEPTYITSHPVLEWVPICGDCLARLDGQ